MVRPLNYVAMAMIALLSAGDSYAAEEDTDCAAAYDGMLSCLSDGGMLQNPAHYLRAWTGQNFSGSVLQS